MYIGYPDVMKLPEITTAIKNQSYGNEWGYYYEYKQQCI